MRKVSIVVVSLLLLGLVGLPALAGEEGKDHDVTVELVSFDAKAKTVTFKTDAGEEKTAPVDDKAIKAFATVHSGDTVVLTCHDNDAGEHQAVTMVKPAKTEKES